jgi:hypothetical protein
MSTDYAVASRFNAGEEVVVEICPTKRKKPVSFAHE